MAKGKMFKTRTGYILRVQLAPPTLFQDLRLQYNIDRPQFKHKIYVEQTGATLEFPYTPPSAPPDKDEDYDGWVLYYQYQAWREEYEYALGKYMVARNKLILSICVDIVRKKTGDWKKEYQDETWVNKLKAADIEVTPDIRMISFLKAVVLRNEQDLLKVLAMATVKEVTLQDVNRALDYFWSIFSGYASHLNSSEIARRRNLVLYALFGGQSSSKSKDELSDVVQ